MKVDSRKGALSSPFGGCRMALLSSSLAFLASGSTLC